MIRASWAQVMASPLRTEAAHARGKCKAQPSWCAGLISCCDMASVAEDALFSLSEVAQLAVLPAVNQPLRGARPIGEARGAGGLCT